MRSSLISAGIALLAGTATASAQTVITREVIAPPPGPVIMTQPPPGAFYSPTPLSPMPAETFVAPQPVQTVQTVETVRVTRPAAAVRRATTKRQVVRSHKSSKPVVARAPRNRAVTPAQQQTIYRTVVRENVAPSPAIVADPAFAQPGYAQPGYAQPGYTMVAPVPSYGPPAQVVTAPVGVAVQTQVPANVYAVPSAGVATTTQVVEPYRYVYEGDRILVIDPNTNIAISAIPR